MPEAFSIRHKDELVDIILRSSVEYILGNIMVGGPCAVGKTTVGDYLAKKLKMVFIDHDEIKEKITENPSPCSVSRLELMRCLAKSLEINGKPEKFVFAVGGDSIFRLNVNNSDRLIQVNNAKEFYKLKVVVLTAHREVLKERFVSSKNRKTNEFTSIWDNWVKHEIPNWEQCADYFIDTSDLIL